MPASCSAGWCTGGTLAGARHETIPIFDKRRISFIFMELLAAEP
jgi:hypothetical protein